MNKWTLENNVNDWVKQQLNSLGFKNRIDFGEESSYQNERIKKALEGGSKTKLKLGTGKPDFHSTKYSVPVVIEDKLHVKKLVSSQNNELKLDVKSIASYAVNGAVDYAQTIISSELYDEVIAIGIAGDLEDDVEIKVYYVHSAGLQPKLLVDVKSLNFLENESSFNEVLKKAKLTSKERHQILVSSRKAIQDQAKKLNKLMNDNAVNVEQRVVYVSGCLLAMQDIIDPLTGQVLKDGLKPENLLGSTNDTERDGIKIVSHIREYFEKVGVPANRIRLLMSTFEGSISADNDRDDKRTIDKTVGALLSHPSSLNKQVFTFIYERVFRTIDAANGHLDIMGEMYSEFLKYATGDGKNIGIVLTPPYVTKMMVEILGINSNSKVMDLATGSAGFLISSMAHMIQEVENAYGKGTSAAINKIKEIKDNQLLGVELDAKMYALATTNMLLRGGSSSANIEKGSSFDRPEDLYSAFKADRLLLNPPFSYDGNGMPFLEFGLNHMQPGGLAAIIVQDSAGSGKAAALNKRILKHHTLKASIKMPGDLFQPNAGVQTSIYILQAGIAHDFDNTVKFIDFRNDGYKRTARGLNEQGSPDARYEDIVKIYKAGTKAALPEAHEKLWDLEKIYVEDQISNSGSDWNFEQHKTIDTSPSQEDFLKTVGNYLSWEVSQLLTQSNGEKK